MVIRGPASIFVSYDVARPSWPCFLTGWKPMPQNAVPIIGVVRGIDGLRGGAAAALAGVRACGIGGGGIGGDSRQQRDGLALRRGRLGGPLGSTA